MERHRVVVVRRAARLEGATPPGTEASRGPQGMSGPRPSQAACCEASKKPLRGTRPPMSPSHAWATTAREWTEAIETSERAPSPRNAFSLRQ